MKKPVNKLRKREALIEKIRELDPYLAVTILEHKTDVSKLTAILNKLKKCAANKKYRELQKERLNRHQKSTKPYKYQGNKTYLSTRLMAMQDKEIVKSIVPVKIKQEVFQFDDKTWILVPEDMPISKRESKKAAYLRTKILI